MRTPLLLHCLRIVFILLFFTSSAALNVLALSALLHNKTVIMASFQRNGAALRTGVADVRNAGHR